MLLTLISAEDKIHLCDYLADVVSISSTFWNIRKEGTRDEEVLNFPVTRLAFNFENQCPSALSMYNYIWQQPQPSVIVVTY